MAISCQRVIQLIYPRDDAWTRIISLAALDNQCNGQSRVCIYVIYLLVPHAL